MIGLGEFTIQRVLFKLKLREKEREKRVLFILEMSVVSALHVVD